MPVETMVEGLTQGGGMPRARKISDSSIRVKAQTKALIDQLADGVPMDTFLYDLLRERTNAPARRTSPAGEYEFEIGETDLPASFVERVERVERAVAGLSGLNLDALLPDPQTGVLFDVTRAPSGDGRKGTDGSFIKLPRDGEAFAREGGVGFADAPPVPGWWVRTPSGVYLTDRDDTLSDELVALVRNRAKSAKRSKKDA
jgi:hypothetical protein